MKVITTDAERLEQKILPGKDVLVAILIPALLKDFSIEGVEAANYQDSYHGLAVMRGDKKRQCALIAIMSI